MSFDLYLLPAATIGLDANLAGDFIKRENLHFSEIPAEIDPNCERKKRELADLLLRMKPTYREFRKDYDAIAKFERIRAAEARRKYRCIEVNGLELLEAQFEFYDRHVVVQLYSAASREEIDAILYSLSLIGDFVVFNPQTREVFDLRA